MTDRIIFNMFNFSIAGVANIAGSNMVSTCLLRSYSEGSGSGSSYSIDIPTKIVSTMIRWESNDWRCVFESGEGIEEDSEEEITEAARATATSSAERPSYTYEVGSLFELRALLTCQIGATWK